MFVGCIPAHAAYFTIYESCNPAFTHQLAGASSTHIDRFAGTLEGSTAAAVGSGTAVTVATIAHDCVMTPMDTIKQRLQLGLHNNSMLHCFGAVVRTEGQRALVISLPVTLCMNMPFAAVMGTTNELLRKRLSPNGDPPSATVYMAAGAGSLSWPFSLSPCLMCSNAAGRARQRRRGCQSHHSEKDRADRPSFPLPQEEGGICA